METTWCATVCAWVEPDRGHLMECIVNFPRLRITDAFDNMRPLSHLRLADRLAELFVAFSNVSDALAVDLCVAV